MITMNGLKKPDRLFVHFMATYLFLLTIPLAIGMFSYVKTLKEVEDTAIQASLSLVSHGERLISQRLSEVESIAEQLSENAGVKRVQSLVKPYEGKNTYLVRQSAGEIPDYTLTNAYIVDLYAYAREPNLVLSSNRVYYANEFRNAVYFADTPWEHGGGALFQEYQWAHYLPKSNVVISERHHSTVGYVRGLGSPTRPTGFVLLFLDSALFESVLDTLNPSSEGWAVILNQEGEVIADRHSEAFAMPREEARTAPFSEEETESGYFTTNLAGREILVVRHVSPYNGWRYYSLQPVKEILQPATQIRNYILVFLGIALFTGFIIAYLLAYRNARPLRSIVTAVAKGCSGEQQKGSPYRYVQDSVTELLTDRKSMQEKMNMQLPYLRSALLRRMIYGYLTEPEEILGASMQLGIDLAAHGYCVAVIRFQRYELTLSANLVRKLAEEKLLLQTIVEECLEGQTAYFLDTEHNRLACLFLFHGLEAPSREPLLLLAKRADNTAKENGLALVWGIGAVTESLAEIPSSYYEADALAGLVGKRAGKNILSSDKVRTPDHLYYYPDEMEYRLLSCVKSGDGRGIRDLLGQLYWENFHNRELVGSAKKILLHELLGTLFRAASREPELPEVKEAIDNVIRAIESNRSFDEPYLMILSTYMLLCQNAASLDETANRNLATEVEAYIREHFSDDSLSLGKVANQFGVSEAYLSQYLKENAGFNYFSFLESLRISGAKALLTGSKRTVKSIALACGYSSDVTFCRAFKRVVGISASQFRKLKGDRAAVS